MVILVAAWLYGYLNSGSEIEPLVREVVTGAERVERRGDVFYVYAQDSLIGYAGVGQASGYSGPIEVLVGLDSEGTIIGVQIVGHKETPGFFRRLSDVNFFEQFIERDYTDSLLVGDGIDAASGATISSEAVARAIRNEVRTIASGPVGANVPAQAVPIQFGVPEVVLIGLFAVGYIGHRSRRRPVKKWARRVTLVTGAVVLGFIYNKPLTVANFISLLSGYWPDWHTNMYWFLLLGGILFVTTAQGKNPYCSWFCPFGAVQEGMGRISGAKLYRPRNLHRPLQWAQRGLAFSAIALGLALRQPGAASYEPFGTLFDFTGSMPQWILLAIILLASFIVYRPFCNYVCPMDPIVDYIGETRRWAQTEWRKVRKA